MNSQHAEPRFFASDDMRPFVAKIALPAILLFGAVCLGLAQTTRPAGVVLCGLIIAFGTIQFIAVGLLKPTEDCIYYRRFTEWRRIEYGDIVKCGRPAFPLFWGLHYLKLRSFEPPLGRLYFVQYHPPGPTPQYDQDRAMIEAIRARVIAQQPSGH